MPLDWGIKQKFNVSFLHYPTNDKGQLGWREMDSVPCLSAIIDTESPTDGHSHRCIDKRPCAAVAASRRSGCQNPFPGSENPKIVLGIVLCYPKSATSFLRLAALGYRAWAHEGDAVQRSALTTNQIDKPSITGKITIRSTRMFASGVLGMTNHSHAA